MVECLFSYLTINLNHLWKYLISQHSSHRRKIKSQANLKRWHCLSIFLACLNALIAPAPAPAIKISLDNKEWNLIFQFLSSKKQKPFKIRMFHKFLLQLPAENKQNMNSFEFLKCLLKCNISFRKCNSHFYYTFPQQKKAFKVIKLNYLE